MGIWSAAGAANTARQQSGGFGNWQAAIVAGGNTGTYSAVTELFNGGVWTTKASLTTARLEYSGFGTNVTGAVVGGDTSGGLTASTEHWNGTAWSAGGNMVSAISLHTCAGTQIAGILWGLSTTATYKYNGTTWSTGVAMPGTNTRTGGAGTQSSTLAFGGETTNTDSGAITTTYSFNGTAWSTGGALNTARRNLSGCGDSNAAALSIGGGSGAAPGTMQATTESYNGTAWTAQGSLNAARDRHTSSGVTTGAVASHGRTTAGLSALTELYGIIVAPPSVIVTVTPQAPSIKIKVNAPSGVITIMLPAPIVITGRIIFPPSMVITDVMPACAVKIPVHIKPSSMVVTLQTPAPSVIPAQMILSVTNFPSGKVVSYQIIDSNNNILQAWTSAGVIERVVDVMANKSVYFCLTTIVGDTFQGHIMWKTNDTTPLTAVEVKTAFETYTYGMRGDMSGVRYDMSQVVRPLVSANLDSSVSSRLASASYTAPNNAGIAAIQAEVNTHPTLAEIEASTILAKQAKLDFVEKWILNKLIESPSGIWKLYDNDNVTVLKTWTWDSGTKTRSKAT